MNPTTFRWGVASIATSAALVATFLYPSLHGDEAVQGMPVEVPALSEAPLIPIPQAQVQTVVIEVPDLTSELTLFAIPPRPDGAESCVGVQLESTGALKWVHLPVRLGLRFDVNGHLRFSEDATQFWVDIASGEREAGIRTAVVAGGLMSHRDWAQKWSEVPIRSPFAFGDNSPFRSWELVRWVGNNLLAARFLAPESSPRYRIERGDGTSFEVQEGDCLFWDGTHWGKEPSQTVVRVQGADGGRLLLEGWDQEGYARIAIPLSAPPPLQYRAEDLFTTVRIRSDRQLSCVLDKQCLILRVGDWVVKEEGRWRVLRRPQERNEYFHQTEEHELFILDRIEMRGAQRVAHGLYYASDRTSAVPMTLLAQSAQRPLKGIHRRGK